MKLEFGSDWVRYKEGLLKVDFPISDAREVDGLVIVLHDYMSFPSGLPSRNLFAYGGDGALVWRVESIGEETTDAVTNIISEKPLIVGNFMGCTCDVDVRSGAILSTQFTK